jgi:hypothetical protein
VGATLFSNSIAALVSDIKVLPYCKYHRNSELKYEVDIQGLDNYDTEGLEMTMFNAIEIKSRPSKNDIQVRTCKDKNAAACGSW